MKKLLSKLEMLKNKVKKLIEWLKLYITNFNLDKFKEMIKKKNLFLFLILIGIVIPTINYLHNAGIEKVFESLNEKSTVFHILQYNIPPQNTLCYTDYWSACGTIISNKPLAKVEIKCVKIDEEQFRSLEPVEDYSTDAMAVFEMHGEKECDIHDMDAALKFNELKPGYYQYQIIATAENKKREKVVCSNFCIGTIDSRDYTIIRYIPESKNIKEGNLPLKEEGTLGVLICKNHDISQVKIAIYNDNNGNKQNIVCESSAVYYTGTHEIVLDEEDSLLEVIRDQELTEDTVYHYVLTASFNEIETEIVDQAFIYH